MLNTLAPSPHFSFRLKELQRLKDLFDAGYNEQVNLEKKIGADPSYRFRERRRCRL